MNINKIKENKGYNVLDNKVGDIGYHKPAVSLKRKLTLKIKNTVKNIWYCQANHIAYWESKVFLNKQRKDGREDNAVKCVEGTDKGIYYKFLIKEKEENLF